MYVYTQINTSVKTRENNSECQFHLNVFISLPFLFTDKIISINLIARQTKNLKAKTAR